MNRFHEIKLNSNINEWYFIPGKNNPADKCTLYNPLTSLTLNSLWIKGPHFFSKNEPVSFESEVPSIWSESTDLNSPLIVYCKPLYRPYIKWENYSLLYKLVKHIVCILKLKRHWMNKKEKLLEAVDFKEMTVKEFCYAEDQIFLETQRESYPKEINALANNKALPKISNLLSLRPFLLDNLLRVGGRIGQSFLSFH